MEVSEPLEALEIIRRRKPDLLIIERHLELVRFLRADKDPAIAEIPIIMTSAKHRHSDVQEAHSSGIDEFLAKPAGIKRLLSYALKALRDRRPFIRSDLYLGPDRRRTAPIPMPMATMPMGIGILTEDEIRVLLRG
ncbi:MAG: response regulator [Rhodospirillales bacterium]|nr:response regulator [Rhodospirillales bacterium]